MKVESGHRQMKPERLQKILARAGYGSRRKCEEMIADGRVKINNRVATLGSKAIPSRDQIYLDGKPINPQERSVYIALYKPRGVLSAVNSYDGRKTVVDIVDVPEKVYPVGRLDIDSEGLILLTNDGALTNRLTHPRYGHEKEYRVLVAKRPDSSQLMSWRRGVVLSDGNRTSPARVNIESLAGKGTWLRVIMKEGRKRQIREIGRLVGLPVVKIIRVRISSLEIGKLKPKEWRYLSRQEISQLKAATKGSSDP